MAKAKKPPTLKQVNITVDGQVFENWGADTVGMAEAEAIERTYGDTFLQLGRDIQMGSITAMRVVAWSLLRREKPDLKLEDVDLPISAVSVDFILEDDEPEGGAVPTGRAAAARGAAGRSRSVARATSPTSRTGSISARGSGST